MYQWKIMSKQESTFIKGIGMLLILFHNYAHVIQPWTGENEFGFNHANGIDFLGFMAEKPMDSLRLLLAFLGHYGVNLFVFMSGYGLFISYRDKAIVWKNFIRRHLIKLYPAFIVVVLLYLALYQISMGPIPARVIGFAVLDLLFVQNFVPGGALQLVGPWWFFSLIVQFYATFPLLMKAFHRFGIRAIVITGTAAWIASIFLGPIAEAYQLNVFFTIIGWLPIFSLGMAFAWLADFKLPWWLIAFSLFAVLVGNFVEIAWPLAMPGATLFLLIVSRYAFTSLSRFSRIFSFILYMGANSLFIFSIHGFLRRPFTGGAEVMGSWAITILLGLTFLLVTLLVSWLVKIVERQIQEKIVRPNIRIPRPMLRRQFS